MYYIKDAKVRRYTELDGVRCAEVEVRPGAADDPELLVYIALVDQGQEYELLRIIRNDADVTLDWYDNNLHSAFEEATETAFTDSALLKASEERDKFKRELLSYGQLTSEMAKEFSV